MRAVGPSGILQEWVAELGLRYQGVLLSVIRGVDGFPADDSSKQLVRRLRGLILYTHCADEEQPSSFIVKTTPEQLDEVLLHFCRRGFDQYPCHFVLHLLHALQVLGVKHPAVSYRHVCALGYRRMCQRMHVNPETEDQLRERLEADEEVFRAGQV